MTRSLTRDQDAFIASVAVIQQDLQRRGFPDRYVREAADLIAEAANGATFANVLRSKPKDLFNVMNSLDDLDMANRVTLSDLILKAVEAMQNHPVKKPSVRGTRLR